MQGLFFTGTDTGVGKTLVTAAVVRSLRRRGQPVDVCKPVVTGARWIDGRWLGEDTVLLAEAAEVAGAWDRVTAWSFPAPAAPPVAARHQGEQLDLAQIVEAVRERSRPGVPLLVEGVGGLLCPLTEQAAIADLAAVLQLPLVVIARRSLGTLNHTLLTLESAKRRGLAVAGVVINETSLPQGLADETNVEELRQRIDVPILAVVPHKAGSTSDEILAIADVDWLRLCKPRAK